MKLTIKDIHQKMQDLKLLDNDDIFIWGNVKRIISKQPILSKKIPMYSLTYKDGYIYITPFTSQKILDKSTIRINLSNILSIDICKDFLTFGKRKVFSLKLKDSSVIDFSVPSIYLEKMKFIKTKLS